jgi:Tfp pilus assembly protein PilO
MSLARLALPRMALDGSTGARLAWSIKRWLVNLRWPGLTGLVLLVIAVAFYAFTVQPARERLRVLAAERTQLSARLGSRGGEAARPSERGQLSNFYAFFPLTDAVPELLGQIARAAQHNRLSLDKGEYRLGRDKDFRLARYQVTFPVRGSYAQVRGFVNAVLDAVPAAALDELTLKRETIGDQDLEARARFTLFLGVE